MRPHFSYSAIACLALITQTTTLPVVKDPVVLLLAYQQKDVEEQGTAATAQHERREKTATAHRAQGSAPTVQHVQAGTEQETP